MALIRLLSRLLNLISSRSSAASAKALDQYLVLYRGRSDDDLRRELARALRPRTPAQAEVDGRFRSLLRRREIPGTQALAIAICLFERYPCDLPAGSALYDEQRQAALCLLDGLNVQMDTGEGKTYAIVVAAIGLLSIHPQVIVITANKYLARRDLKRVQPLLAAAGISGTNQVPDPGFRGLAYCTLTDLCFQYLNRSYSITRDLPRYPGEAAILIDEIDSVLLDQSLGHISTRSLPATQPVWAEVFALAESWNEQQYSIDPIWDQVSLTASAWDEVVELSKALARPTAMLLSLIAAAVWANQARQGVDYDFDGDQIYLINSITGARYTPDDERSKALQYKLSGEAPAVSLRVAEINGTTLLSRHKHVVGLSGTVAEDTIYYLLTLRTMTTVIAPRWPRYHKSAHMLVSASRDDTYDYIARRIKAVSPRPVVIGTWSPTEAHHVADWLHTQGVVDPAALGVVTSFESDEHAELLELAGHAGRVTVLSQGGSRGVDIRSTQRPLLIVLGLQREPRLNRQFLGRVGRHGEPFDAEVILDPETPLWSNNFGLAPKMMGYPVELPRVSARNLRSMQRGAWNQALLRRQRQSIESVAIGLAEFSVAGRLRQLQDIIGNPEERLSADDGVRLAKWVAVGSGRDRETPAEDEAIVLTGIGRRIRSDCAVHDFESAISAALNSSDTGFTAKTVQAANSTALIELAEWINTRPGQLAEADATLFQAQLQEIAAQRWGAESSPHFRGVAQIALETVLMSNADHLVARDNRLRALRISADRDHYYRQAAFAVRNQQALSELALRGELAANLSRSDRPQELDSLFFSSENRVRARETESIEDDAAVPIVRHEAPVVFLDPAEAERVVADFVQHKAALPGGLPVGADFLRLFLLDTLRPFQTGGSLADAQEYAQHVDLLIDAMAGKGQPGRDLRALRNLATELSQVAHTEGLIPTPLVKSSGRKSAIARGLRFARTIPPLGFASIGLYLLLIAVALAVPIALHRAPPALVAVQTRFGFAQHTADRPLLWLFATLVVVSLAVQSIGHQNPAALTALATPVVGLGLAIGLYGDRISAIPQTIAVALLLIVWGGALSTVSRLAESLVGITPNTVVAAVAFGFSLVQAALDGALPEHAPVLLGIAAALIGPSLPVTVDAAIGASRDARSHDETTRLRIAVDTRLLSALGAFVVVVLIIGVHGHRVAVVYGVAQVGLVAILTTLRMRASRLRALFARLGVGCPYDGPSLDRYLRKVGRVTVSVAAALTAAVTAIVISSRRQPSAYDLLLDEWGGLILVAGLRQLLRIFSVGGSGATSAVEVRDSEQSTLSALKERLRAWRQLRFARLIEIVVLVGVLARPVSWVLKVIKIGAGVSSLLHHVVH